MTQQDVIFTHGKVRLTREFADPLYKEKLTECSLEQRWETDYEQLLQIVKEKSQI